MFPKTGIKVKKISGFTLVEVLTGLMITAVVGGIVTSSWIQGEKVFTSLQIKQDSLIKSSFKLERISKDILNASQLILIDSNKFYFRDTLGTHVFVRDKNLLIAISSSDSDTLLYNVNEMHLHTICQSAFINVIQFQIGQHHMELQKQYGADIYINYCG